MGVILLPPTPTSKRTPKKPTQIKVKIILSFPLFAHHVRKKKYKENYIYCAKKETRGN